MIQKLFFSGKKFKQGDWRWYLLAVYRPMGFLAARRVLRDMSQIDKQHKDNPQARDSALFEAGWRYAGEVDADGRRW